MVDVSRETQDRIDTFLSLLEVWNLRINLVSKGVEADWWSRHVLDSLQLASLLPPGDGAVADLGSGGGFPGIILAAALHRPFHLVESDRRKCAFLREAARAMALTNVTVHDVRIQQLHLPPVMVVTARALAPLATLLGYAHRIMSPEGIAIFPKGRTAQAELTAAAGHWHMTAERFASQTDPEATIFRIRNISPA